MTTNTGYQKTANPAQGNQNFEKMSAAADQAADVAKETYSTTMKGAQDYSAKVLEFAQANTISAFEYARQLFSVKSPTEFFELSNTHLRDQFERLLPAGPGAGGDRSENDRRDDRVNQRRYRQGCQLKGVRLAVPIAAFGIRKGSTSHALRIARCLYAGLVGRGRLRGRDACGQRRRGQECYELRTQLSSYTPPLSEGSSWP